jgi:hypothetical protein
MNERPFAELPVALVQEVLDRTQDIGNDLLLSFQDMQAQKHQRREQMITASLLRREADLEYSSIPTTCGIDGAFAIERLLATDLVAAAAVAMEGLTPPSDARFWPEPRHQVVVETEAHDPDSGTIARAIMMGMELSLAIQAPHDVVFLDGSLTTPIIFFNQALSKAAESPNLYISKHLKNGMLDYIKAYSKILKAQRSDKSWVAMPKYTTRREIGSRLNWPVEYDDRAMLTNILQPGELTSPIELAQPDKPWHLGLNGVHPEQHAELRKLVTEIESRLLVLLRDTN